MIAEKWMDFEQFVRRIMTREDIPGVAIAVSKKGEIIYQKGFGFGDIQTREAISPTTIFGTASVTKSFTAAVILKLEKEGRLSVDDPVIEYLPQFRLRQLEDRDSVKIHHLLSHTTGVPPMRRREEILKIDDHLDYLATEEFELLGRPGEYFSYCNDTFLLLGGIIERLTGQLTRRYITQHLLHPLQMNRSTFSLEELAKLDQVTVPYVKNAITHQIEEAPWPTLGVYEVGGGVRSNVLDLLKYGHMYFQDRYLDKMWQPVHRVARNAFYGYALRSTHDYGGVTLVKHGGGQPGVSSCFGFVPEEDLVVAVLTNLSHVPAEQLWLAAVNTALGLPLEQKENIEPDYDASLEELQRMIGIYRSAEGGHVRIFLDGKSPKAEIDQREFALRSSDSSTLVLKENEEPIRFFFKQADQAWALMHGSRMLTRAE
ncbi:serine hydrolase domain-containing protein [Brevibacillus sp. AY1]|uniref:serine hydrolase domain-containing protein n=1 Tax=Brevibacillus sp. AY1 TaxID=2807621 RepID=UPI0024561A57|nr:serine hydrolase domain-containing protein [Brevibacillus sp. AY1]MDH4619711.1 beta-lactamase family protein [Brevibacillus sp. AY1]